MPPAHRFVIRVAAVLAVALAAGAPGSATAAPSTHRPIVLVGQNKSSNWSGYNQGSIEQGDKLFNQVSATWKVPKATQHKAGEAEYSSTWVGIGGGCVDASCNVTDSTLIQVGTESDVNRNGKASYSAWYELIPAPSLTISGFSVSPGNKISANIAESPANSNVWSIQLANLSTGRTFSTTVPYSSTHATVEWIVETPIVADSGGNVTIGPMPNLSRVRFDSARVNGASANLKASESLQLTPSDGVVWATPSAPDAGADGFNDCTYARTCPVPR